MARIDFNHRMRVTAQYGCIQIRRMEETRQHRLAGGGAVDGQSRKFAHTMPGRAKGRDLLAVEFFGRQSFFGIEAYGDGADKLSVVILAPVRGRWRNARAVPVRETRSVFGQLRFCRGRQAAAL